MCFTVFSTYQVGDLTMTNIVTVTKFCEGGSLKSLISNSSTCHFNEETQVKLWMKQITSAVKYLHSQTPSIIHRDLKPQVKN